MTSDRTLLNSVAVSKKLCRGIRHSIVYSAADMAREMLGMRADRSILRPAEFWAVRGISLALSEGEAVGIIGANGAGKTTFLKMLSGLIRPDEGRVEVRGRVAPLLALGAGFSPALTGRENIRINLALLGMPIHDIAGVESAVIEFSELEHAIDAPLQSYSSGMYARLAFACAVHCEPDIMLIDEVLAVGDLKFRLKCYRRLGELRKRGVAFIVVSHQPQTLLGICERAIYLSNGACIADGPCGEVMRRYEVDQLGSPADRIGDGRLDWSFSGGNAGPLAITRVCIRDDRGEVVASARTAEPTRICVSYASRTAFEGCALSIAVQDASLDNERVLHLSSSTDGVVFGGPAGAGEIELRFPSLGLRPGSYTLKIGINRGTLDPFDLVDGLRLLVSSDLSMLNNNYYQERSWSHPVVDG